MNAAAAAASRPVVPSPYVVEFRGVTKCFEEKVILDDISFFVEDIPDKGELITVVGQSGCGKSTLCKLIAGLEPHYPPTRGEVLAFGTRVEGPSSDRGVVDQKYSLLPHLTVLGNVAFGLKLQGVPRRERESQALEWLRKIDLGGAAARYPFELSGGMQQRVAIAATLILHPRIIIMDEPFGALDPKIRIQMQALLVSLWQEQESTVFFVTHSAEEAVYLGDRVLRMRSNPGTIAEIIPAPRPDRPLKEMRKEAGFRELCDHIREKLEQP
ncbi:MAG: ABC transporter ATP-binding protein [Verrucomicrobiae bacterium]